MSWVAKRFDDLQDLKIRIPEDTMSFFEIAGYVAPKDCSLSVKFRIHRLYLLLGDKTSRKDISLVRN